ncbi:MAG: secondary thiamine-phosphate synthase enzyme YjbQ [Candidatus Shapirobacteria bacterium]|nr:secondary thiamine-phosphate synthase enzyme YjbQ [Candidatus Shapirobacteria bacterium]MDD4410114.1 secondary thiamine-phosphate synthase enzyme YjbQ [Candidatus Shapirobacteria bacterium]
MIKNTTINFKSEEQLEFRDITDEVENFIKETKVKNGNVLVFSTHTTLAICINEKEKGIVKDFKNLINKLIPKDGYYCHNDLNIRTENLVCQSAASDCLNGHSHCTHLLMRNSETIPIVDGKMALGIWQRIFAIELDCCRNRKVIVQVIGE